MWCRRENRSNACPWLLATRAPSGRDRWSLPAWSILDQDTLGKVKWSAWTSSMSHSGARSSDAVQSVTNSDGGSPTTQEQPGTALCRWPAGFGEQLANTKAVDAVCRGAAATSSVCGPRREG